MLFLSPYILMKRTYPFPKVRENRSRQRQWPGKDSDPRTSPVILLYPTSKLEKEEDQKSSQNVLVGDYCLD